MYTGTLSYFAQLQAQHQLSAIAFKANIFPIFNTDPTNPTQAVSRVKALQLANTQGQQIYKIDSTNIDTVLPKLNLSSTIKQDIQSSVNAGKYVITHTDNVSVPGWSGAGYAIIDPLTGSDAYLISGGVNGGIILIMTGLFMMTILFFAIMVEGPISIMNPIFVATAFAVSVLLMTAGLSLLAGKKSACLISMTLALLLIKRILLKSGVAMFSSLYSSLAFPVSAFAICQCDEGC